MKKLFIAVFVFTYGLSALAQNTQNDDMLEQFRQFQKSNQENCKSFQEETQKIFNDFKAESERKFKAYQESINRSFANMLSEEWSDYTAETETNQQESPVAPPTYDTAATVAQVEIESSAVRNVPAAESEDVFVRFDGKIPPADKTTANFDFYGTTVGIAYDQSILEIISRNNILGQLDDIWLALSETGYIPTLNSLLEARYQMNLNDWGYVRLVNSFANNLTADKNAACVLSWFYLNQSKYAAKLAKTDTQAGLLLPVIQNIYGRNYTTIDHQNYYLFGADLKTFQTYGQNFESAYKFVDLEIRKPINFAPNKKERALSLAVFGIDSSIVVESNQNYIDFLKDYPLTDLSVYFNSAASSELYFSLIPVLKYYLDSLPEDRQLNLLQAFFQYNFPYEVDDEQFGYEKSFFPDEMIAYQASDCEDRSVFYAWMVREAFGKPVAGLRLPGHVACAVKTDTDIKGDFVKMNGDKYLVCDPSYINSPVGRIIPSYSDEPADIIAIYTDQTEHNRNHIYEFLSFVGMELGNKRKSIYYDAPNKCYFALGSYSGNLELADSKLSARLPDLALVKLDEQGQAIWAKSAGTKGAFNNAISITRDNANHLVAASTILRDTSETFVRTDFIVSQFDSDGNRNWSQKVFTDSIMQQNYDHYAAYIDTKGTLVWEELLAASDRYQSNEIQSDSNGYFVSFPLPSFGQSLVDTVYYASSAAANPTQSLVNEFTTIKSSDYDQAVAGVFALLNTLNIPGRSISGYKIQQAIDNASPAFKRDNRDLYDDIAKVKKISNVNSKLVIETTTGSKIRFGQVQIGHQSNIDVIRYQSGNAKLVINQGIEVVKMVTISLNAATVKRDGVVLFNIKEKDYAFKVRPEIIN